MKRFIEQLATFGDRPFIHTEAGSHTYRELIDAIEQQLAQLRQAHVQPGDVVFVQGDYALDRIALFLALHENANIVALNTADNPGEIDGKLGTSGASFIADARGLRAVARPAASPPPLIAELVANRRSGLILFSSGTTGQPKAMLHDLDRLIDSYGQRKARSLRIMLFLLFDHIGGINTLLNVLSMGGAATIPSTKSPDKVAELIARHQVEVLPTSPTFLNLLLLSGAWERHPPDALRMITYGTEPMPDGLLTRLRARLPRVKFMQTFGTSETGIVSTSSVSSDSLYMKFNDPAIEHRVVDGELWLRSTRRILGYLNHTADSFTDDGWFKTGDMVEEAQDGQLRILGRLKEVINVGGEKVFPAEVESVLLRHPYVRDCKAYGEGNSVTGQFVSADIVLDHTDDDAIDKALREIRQHARAHMDRYKVPVRLTAVPAIAYSARFKKVLR
jgi:acyl-CoA synthetase (AMP-forming)/AMP-acid ligase II